MGSQGQRISPKGDTEVWARNLKDGSVAVGLYNKNGGSGPVAPCPEWNTTTDGYEEACGGASGDLACFTGVALADAQSWCCNSAECAGFSYRSSDSSGCYKV